MEPYYNDWLIPTYDVMSKIQTELDRRQEKVDEIQSRINDLGIITRSKKTQHEELKTQHDFAKRLLRSQTEFKAKYNEDFRIIKSQTEDFGWRYPTWAQWPRDADLFHREAGNAYMAKRDLIAFGRAT